MDILLEKLEIVRQMFHGFDYRPFFSSVILKKLLADEIKIRSRHNITKSKSLLDMLDGALKKYQITC